MKEKRRFKRLNVALPVTLRWNGRLIPATTLNVSCGGACLDLENGDLEEKSGNVEVIIDLDQESQDVSVRGEVVRVEGKKGSKVGIKFTNLYAVGHQTLEQYINRNLN